MSLDVERYRMSQSKKITKTYSVPLDEGTLRELHALKTQHNIAVSKWVRDLILNNLPELKERVAE